MRNRVTWEAVPTSDPLKSNIVRRPGYAGMEWYVLCTTSIGEAETVASELNERDGVYALLLAERERSAKLEADPRLQIPLDGPGSHRADLAELRAMAKRVEEAEATIKSDRTDGSVASKLSQWLHACEAEVATLREALFRVHDSTAVLNHLEPDVNDQMMAALAQSSSAAEAFRARIRRETLEEAAKVADELGAGAPNLLLQRACSDIAGCIRTLASKEDGT